MPEDGKVANKAVTAAETVIIDSANSTAREIAKIRRHSHNRALLAEAKKLAWAADRLLHTADQVLAETRQGGKETAELLDRLEARLASHG